MRETAQAQLLALLRAGLWDIPVEAEYTFNQDTDWNAILILAKQQTVLGLVANAIFHLPEAQQPEQKLMVGLAAQVSAIAKSHALQGDTLVKVSSMLKDNGIVPVLLKGQGMAALYPEPTLRTCGDIDLYVGKQNFALACQLLMKMPGTDIDHPSCLKHFSANFNGVSVEIHRIVEQLSTPRSNSYFQRWCEANLGKTDTDTVEISGVDINVPSKSQNAVIIFNHLWHHFLSGGIGLRQLCDWAMVLHKAKDEIDLPELEKLLKNFNLWEPWSTFSHIAVGYLGLPETELPFYFYDASKQKQAEQILGRILMEGNFGHYAKSFGGRPDGIIKGKLHSFRHISQRTVEIARLIPFKYTAEYYVNYLFHGIAAVPKALLERHHNQSE